MSNDILVKSFNGYNFYKIPNISKDPRTTHIMYVYGKSGAYKGLHYMVPEGLNLSDRAAYENEMFKKLLADIQKADRYE